MKILFQTLALVLITSLAFADQAPNIIIIMADDFGYAGPSCFGNPHFKTPEMDRLAADVKGKRVEPGLAEAGHKFR